MTPRQKQTDSYWMPFTANRDFKKHPRLIAKAQGHYYQTADDRKLYDSFSGLWTSGLGHCHPKLVEAVQKQVAELDYCMSFQLSHDKAFQLAEMLTATAPKELSHCFFTNSGSEAVDTALKIALAYHHANGETQRTRLIGRERGYHGVNFGGLSVGGISANRKVYNSNLISNTDHLPHTHNLETSAFSKGLPEYGAHLADALERLCALHDGSNIAAVIVEPVAGSTGILPPPVGYLERLREICSRHGILLIFDEVITAFGRVGDSFAASRFDVLPDIITTAKGLTNGVIPMGAVLVQEKIHKALMQGPDHTIELLHGYTYSGHPVAAAAGIACMEIYKEEGIFQQARELEPLFEELLHSFRGHQKVIDIRNFGLMGAIELQARENIPGVRGLEVHKKCFWEENLVIRNGGDTLQFAPFLNSNPDDLLMTFETIRRVLDSIE